ncbi:MAG: hypothetical protein FWD57_10430 [Polyangiaceae bacterium]|nr:hypothetical protein [Polyangiaceae bacterium]
MGFLSIVRGLFSSQETVAAEFRDHLGKSVELVEDDLAHIRENLESGLWDNPQWVVPVTNSLLLKSARLYLQCQAIADWIGGIAWEATFLERSNGLLGVLEEIARMERDCAERMRAIGSSDGCQTECMRAHKRLTEVASALRKDLDQFPSVTR